MADVAEPHVVGGVEARLGAQVAIGEAPERPLDLLEMPAPEGLASHRTGHPIG